jgi:glycosyltransferase involved in cell wall biosynthesis
MEFRVWYKGRGELKVKRVSINREVEYDKEEEGDILAGLANKYSKANCFLIPIATLFNALEIKKPRVILLHDLVQFEFQELFLLEKKLNYSFIKDYERKLSEFAEQGCFFISNSDYVRKNHTLKFIKNVEENRTGFVYIPVNIPQDIERRILTQHETLKKYNIKDNYLFYPTQIRPYKNLITLLKALKILLDRNVNLSVVLTGNPDDSPICKHYIKEKGLDKKIILTGDVPEIDLYSLHKYALATVVPTLFEGGFPWQGLEAMLMNTPAIMSKIPVTIERLKFAGLDPENCGLKMFNPEDEVELAEKILEVLKDRDRAVIEQLPVKEKLFTYTWDDVSHLYYKIFTEEVLKE